MRDGHNNKNTVSISMTTTTHTDTPGTQPETGRILLVDDELAFQRLAKLPARHWPAPSRWQATRAGWPRSANHHPELVLPDPAMPPHMDPETALELIPPASRAGCFVRPAMATMHLLEAPSWVRGL